MSLLIKDWPEQGLICGNPRVSRCFDRVTCGELLLVVRIRYNNRMRNSGGLNRAFLFACLIILLVITVPFLAAIFFQGEEHVFGGFLLNPFDGNSYLAKMYQGWRGDVTFHLPYSAERSDGVFLFMFYIALGHTARITQLSLLVVFHLARLAAASLLVWVVYRHLVKHFRELDRSIFTLLLFGLGMGWLVLPFGWIASDLWVAEGYPFLSAYVNPHFPLGLAVMTILVFRDPGDYDTRSIAVDMLLAFVLAVTVPFGVVIIGCVLGVEAGLELLTTRQWRIVARKFVRLLLISAISLPVLVYDLWVVNIDPLLAGWNAQNLTPSPPIWDFLISFSPALLLAIPALLILRSGAARFVRIAAIWLLVGFFLMYLPFGLQRRMITGLFIPVAVLAAYFLNHRFDPDRSKRYARWLIIASLPSVLVVLLLAAAGILQKAPELYLWRAEREAFSWIEAQTPADALFLAAPNTGLLIPAYTGRRVIYGHPFETVEAEENELFVENLIKEVSQGSVAGVPVEVDYLFWGPREVSLSGVNTPDLPDPPIYVNESVQIFTTQP